MPVKFPDSGRVREVCWACSGAGFRMRSVAPVTFSVCWMCNGNRGKYETVSEESK